MVFAGSGAAGALGAAATAAGTGAVGEGREPRVSKPVSRRSFWTGAGAKAGARAGARAGAAVGARVGDIRPEGGITDRIDRKHSAPPPATVKYSLGIQASL